MKGIESEFVFNQPSIISYDSRVDEPTLTKEEQLRRLSYLNKMYPSIRQAERLGYIKPYAGRTENILSGMPSDYKSPTETSVPPLLDEGYENNSWNNYSNMNNAANDIQFKSDLLESDLPALLPEDIKAQEAYRKVVDKQTTAASENNKDVDNSDSFYSGLTGIQYPKKENTSDVLSGLKSLQDDYWNEISKLSRPTRKYANRPNDIPLPDTMDYNENYTVNPFKSVTDYTDNSYMNTLSALHPALAIGIGVSNMFTNPMKQKYFREREEYNKAEEARRKNEELRYERARQKYLDEFDRRNRLQDESMKKYGDEQAIYNTMYSDAKSDFDTKREDVNTRFEQNKGMFDVARQLRKEEKYDKIKLIESVGSPIDLEDVIFYGNDAVKAAKEYNALREQLANSNVIPEEAKSRLKEKARKVQSLMRSNINPVGSVSNERVNAYINNNNIKPITPKKFGESAEQLAGGILAWAADNIGLHKTSKEAYERINLRNKAAEIAKGLDSDTELYAIPIDVLNPVVGRAARAAGVNKNYKALVTRRDYGEIQDVYFIHKGDIVTAADIQSMNNKIRDDIKLEQAQ